MLDYKNKELVVKGFANHRRLQIMELLEKNPELAVEDIADALNVNYKTISVHIRKLARANLVIKRYEGHKVMHKLTNRSKEILKFLRILE